MKLRLNNYEITDTMVKLHTDGGLRMCMLHLIDDNRLSKLLLKCEQLEGEMIDTVLKWNSDPLKWFIDIRPYTVLSEFSESERTSQRVYGPPGTGKTYSMMRLIEKRLSEGVKPHEIAFVSFTNVAANEAKKRVVEEFPEYNEDEFTNFRTLHSLAARLGAIGGFGLMDDAEMLNFDRNIKVENSWTAMGDANSIKIRCKHPALSILSLSNARKEPIEDVFEEAMGRFISESVFDANIQILHRSYQINSWGTHGMDALELTKDWISKYEDYKRDNSLIDYDDMIAKINSGEFDKSQVRYKLFILDEAQDCSTPLWDFARVIADQSKETLIVGDDHQAIMEGFGANRKAFMDFETTKEDIVLETSYRLPVDAHARIMEMMDTFPEDYKHKEFGILTNAPKGVLEGFSDTISQGLGLITSVVSTIVDTLTGNTNHSAPSELQTIIDKINDPEQFGGDWLILSLSNLAVIDLSNKLLECGISHYRKNKPMIARDQGRDMPMRDIRVQTIHTSKGSQAENVVIYHNNADMQKLFEESVDLLPVRYVAESRTKNRMFCVTG